MMTNTQIRKEVERQLPEDPPNDDTIEYAVTITHKGTKNLLIVRRKKMQNPMKNKPYLVDHLTTGGLLGKEHTIIRHLFITSRNTIRSMAVTVLTKHKEKKWRQHHKTLTEQQQGGEPL